MLTTTDVKPGPEEAKQNLTCQFCNKVYASRAGKSYHVRYYCHLNKDRVERDQRNTKSQTVAPQTDLNLLLQTVCDIAKKSKVINNTVNNVNNTLNQIHNNNGFQLRSFGQETLHHLTSDFLTDCVNKRSTGLIKLIEKVHCDPSVPENHNIRKKSEKKALVETFQDGTWIVQDKNTVMNDVLKHGHKILFQHHLDNSTKDENTYEYDEFMANLMTGNTIMYYKLRKNIYLMITREKLCIFKGDAPTQDNLEF
jgi:hypothetical protein